MSDNLDFTILRLPTNNDKAYRDAACMAYISAVMDLPASEFYPRIRDPLKNSQEAEGLLRILQRDFEIRTRRLLGV